MDKKNFRAFIVSEIAQGVFQSRVGIRGIESLPAGDVLIRVRYSSLNYKDALSARGHKGVTKRYPHTPGIDAAGEVVCSGDNRFAEGTRVIVTGFDLGMNTSGGFGEYIRVPSQWVVKLPDGMAVRESMVYGTAGMTAGLSLMKLERNGLTPNSGDILVTGASGGVGCMAVALLAKRGYRVIAATGKPEQSGFLHSIGAIEVIDRKELEQMPVRAMLRERWAGVIDSVGGRILEAAIRATKREGSVTCCGLVASHDLKMEIYPFILRGINVLGISANQTPIAVKEWIWHQFAGQWKCNFLDSIGKECSLEQLEPCIDGMMRGKSIGRTVVKVS
ncbi:MAG: YhdH/YhfP family quinone oxidoreductase [bacterium]|nr:YhdH/YhfP family quinone oxidoreductase [bacterium]